MTVTYRTTGTAELDALAIDGIWTLCLAAFGEVEMRPEDLAHALGGHHFLAEADGAIVGHASVVERTLEVGGRPVRTGYVEAVAVLPAWQRQGIATALMASVGAHIRESYALGALGTGHPGFYARLGWRVWQGPTWVRTTDGPERSEGEDGGILVLETPRTPPMTGHEPISCEWRPGDAW
jgi:aminoglycoside 2'-N-acetyltransferase I